MAKIGGHGNLQQRGGPNVPTSVVATATSSSEITLTWVDASSDNTGHRIYRSLNGAPFVLIATTGLVQTYNDTGLNASTTYHYYVTAYRGTHESARSNLTSTTTMSGANWQLAAGHFEPSHQPAELIYPRPDAETPVWAKHRRHYPGVKYEIPIGVSFGSWPYYFEGVTLPTGARVGSWLTQSGDKLIAGDEYGVVTWDSPTIGTHSFHVRVYQQDGSTPVDVQWQLEVTTSGTLFLDAVNGDDANSGLTPLVPKKTIDGWYKASSSDRTFSQYQVCYKAGTYDVVTADLESTNIRMFYWDKPLVHYAYNSDAVTFNFNLGTWNVGLRTGTAPPGDLTYGSDMFFGRITCSGGLENSSAGGSSRRWFFAAPGAGLATYSGSTSGHSRNTWFKCPQIAWTNTVGAANNAGICVGFNTGAGKRRHYWLIDRCDASDILSIPGDTINWNGWYIGNSTNMLGQNMTVANCNFGKGVVAVKSSGYKLCLRNIDCSVHRPDQRNFELPGTGSYDTAYGGNCEMSYCKVINANTSNSTLALMVNYAAADYLSSEPFHQPNYLFRNSVARIHGSVEVIQIRAGGTNGIAWPTYVYRDVWCSNGDGFTINASGQGLSINTQDNGQWVIYPIVSNPFDSSMNLTGAARTQYLGTRGAEVA